ncbi:DinB family protein [Paracidovorax cattleyae]|uniref:Uncharacterized damage-inducible protein DinB (Forms a four-helix bundle) n=1 Tax=Paracidovorax cattleyae TaxID=80868 RepID=A0A1H0QF73_9BURK|nr:DinB family protein [Paracidovorax cattleyae]SDP15840.1 Uncharacterized damage-inducible protein DinB (forms a four-helix bundle) [Paracidovorax cattleyae]
MDASLVSLFKFKRWSNGELLALGIASRDQLPADDFRTFSRLLNHTWCVDRIFRAHLTGDAQRAPLATNTEETPALEALLPEVQASDDWFVRYVEALDTGALAERIAFRFTDGDTGTMSRAEMLHHLLLHGTYHRGAAGRILAVHGVQPPRDAITTFLHRFEPGRRW